MAASEEARPEEEPDLKRFTALFLLATVIAEVVIVRVYWGPLVMYGFLVFGGFAFFLGYIRAAIDDWLIRRSVEKLMR